MPYVFSTINLKGGVGKTTVSVALAEYFASDWNKSVLVIDLDPQTNATVMMIGEKRWETLNENGLTIANMFRQALPGEDATFNFDSARQRNVSDVSGTRNLDLLPSSLDLIHIQDELVNIDRGAFHAITPASVLSRASRDFLHDYDIVIIDCPPNLGFITQNGLVISDGYIIPTIPDVLSTYGIPQILTRVAAFAEAVSQDIDPLGIVVTKYQANSNVHRNTVATLNNNDQYPPVYNSIIKQANQVADAAAHVSGRNRTYRQKWGYRGLAEDFMGLGDEILKQIEQDDE